MVVTIPEAIPEPYEILPEELEECPGYCAATAQVGDVLYLEHDSQDPGLHVVSLVDQNPEGPGQPRISGLCYQSDRMEQNIFFLFDNQAEKANIRKLTPAGRARFHETFKDPHMQTQFAELGEHVLEEIRAAKPLAMAGLDKKRYMHELNDNEVDGLEEWLKTKQCAKEESDMALVFIREPSGKGVEIQIDKTDSYIISTWETKHPDTPIFFFNTETMWAKPEDTFDINIDIDPEKITCTAEEILQLAEDTNSKVHQLVQTLFVLANMPNRNDLNVPEWRDELIDWMEKQEDNPRLVATAKKVREIFARDHDALERAANARRATMDLRQEINRAGLTLERLMQYESEGANFGRSPGDVSLLQRAIWANQNLDVIQYILERMRPIDLAATSSNGLTVMGNLCESLTGIGLSVKYRKKLESVKVMLIDAGIPEPEPTPED